MVWGREGGIDPEGVEDSQLEAQDYMSPVVEVAGIQQSSNEISIHDLPTKRVKLKGKTFLFFLPDDC